jgi:hypothetical protein
MDAEGLMVSDDQKRFRNQLHMVGAIVGILAALTPGVIWAVDHFGGSTSKPGTGTQQQGAGQVPGPGGGQHVADTQAQTPDPAATTGGAAAADRVYLETLSPDSGHTNLAALPRELSGQAGYEHAVTVPCGSNNSGDTKRQVTYLLERRYVTFTADVRAYKKPADEYKLQLRVYADNAQPQVVELQPDQRAPLSMSVDGVKKLMLEVTCERPGGQLTLAGAWFGRG